jgi:hypothetical protein
MSLRLLTFAKLQHFPENLRENTHIGEELFRMLCPKGPFHGISGIIGIAIPLICALLVGEELEDAR